MDVPVVPPGHGVRPTRSLSGDPVMDELEACAEIIGTSFCATTSPAELEERFDDLPAFVRTFKNDPQSNSVNIF